MSQAGEDANSIRELLKFELLAVTNQLDELSRGQAVLASTMEKMNRSLVQLTGQEPKLSMGGEMSVRVGGKSQRDDNGRTTERDSQSHENSLNSRGAHGSASMGLRSGLTMELSRATQAHGRSAKSLRESTAFAQLNRIVEVDAVTRAEEQLKAEQWAKSSPFQKMMMLKTSTKDLALDAAISGVIVSNSIFIGISADHWDGEVNIYSWIDVVFGLIFITELVLKLKLHGFLGHFNGKDRISNLFDVTLVVLDTLQLSLVFFAKEYNQKLKDEGIPSASLFRVIRVVRVTRIIRLLRYPVFSDLLKMVEGVIMGQQTLLWASVLFGVVVYVVALLSKDAFGGPDKQHNFQVYENFNSVPRSMYTVFRCSFGDCNNDLGQPIPEFIQKSYGGFVAILYCFFLFFIAIGLFNVISAIFVDSTMARAAANQSRKLAEKFANDKLWCQNVCTILRACLTQQSEWVAQELEASDGRITESMHDVEFDADTVHQVCVNDKKVKNALSNLEIDFHDHDKLADVLDPDHSGTIGFQELVNGLQRLRGQPRRSDVVTVDLMLRATQEKLDDIHHLLALKLDQISLVQKSTYSLLQKIATMRTTRCSTDLTPEVSLAQIEPSFHENSQDHSLESLSWINLGFSSCYQEQ